MWLNLELWDLVRVETDAGVGFERGCRVPVGNTPHDVDLDRFMALKICDNCGFRCDLDAFRNDLVENGVGGFCKCKQREFRISKVDPCTVGYFDPATVTNFHQ